MLQFKAFKEASCQNLNSSNVKERKILRANNSSLIDEPKGMIFVIITN